MKNSTIIFLVCLFLCPIIGTTQNLLGGYICTKRIQPLTSFNYSINVEMYVQGSMINNSYVHIDWGDQSPIDSLQYTGATNTSGGIKKKLLSGIHTYQPGQLYHIFVIENFYVANVSNIPNSGAQQFQLQYDLYTNAGLNSSPVSTFPLIDSSFYCTVNANFGITDSDGDSLSYSLITPTNIPTYVMPSATVDVVGTLTVSSTYSQRNAVSLKVDEWRKVTVNGPYAVSGTSYLELMFMTCASNPLSVQAWKNENQVRIYPNPVLDELTCDSFYEEIIGLSITDPVGQEVFMRKNPQSKEIIKLDFLSNGIYFLKLQTKDDQKIFRIVKE